MNFPVFDTPVGRDGYAWWYLDALSDDGQHGLAVIAFIGSVFSPYYYLARSHARHKSTNGAEPTRYCAFNVALYGPTRRWTMTERDRPALACTSDRLVIGPSAMHWDGDRLVIDIDERGTPLPRRVRGKIVVTPEIRNARSFALDAASRHIWHPYLPAGRVHVQMNRPRLDWHGQAYCDHNRGSRALEADFRQWHWARVSDGQTTWIDYNVVDCNNRTRDLSLAIDANGQLDAIAPVARHRLRQTAIWRMPRLAHGDTLPAIVRTLEDTPFYARSEIATRRDGVSAKGVHESLSLARFVTPWVRTLLRFRMPRISASRSMLDRR